MMTDRPEQLRDVGARDLAEVLERARLEASKEEIDFDPVVEGFTRAAVCLLPFALAAVTLRLAWPYPGDAAMLIVLFVAAGLFCVADGLRIALVRPQPSSSVALQRAARANAIGFSLGFVLLGVQRFSVFYFLPEPWYAPAVLITGVVAAIGLALTIWALIGVFRFGQAVLDAPLGYFGPLGLVGTVLSLLMNGGFVYAALFAPELLRTL